MPSLILCATARLSLVQNRVIINNFSRDYGLGITWDIAMPLWSKYLSRRGGEQTRIKDGMIFFKCAILVYKPDGIILPCNKPLSLDAEPDVTLPMWSLVYKQQTCFCRPASQYLEHVRWLSGGTMKSAVI